MTHHQVTTGPANTEQASADGAPAEREAARDTGGVTRRGLMRTAVLGGVVTAAGAGLAACGNVLSPNENGSGSAPSSSASGAPPAGAGAPNAQAAGGGQPQYTPTGGEGGAATSSAAAPGTGMKPAGTALAKTSAIPVGSGKIFTSEHVVVSQPTAGQFKAFSTTCTHQQCQCNQISNGQITCPCHGAAFSLKDGSVTQPPAPSPLAAKTVAVYNGEVYLQD